MEENAQSWFSKPTTTLGKKALFGKQHDMYTIRRLDQDKQKQRHSHVQTDQAESLELCLKSYSLSAWIGTARQRSSRRRVALARGEACRACGTMICGWHWPQGFPKLLLDDYKLTLSFSETWWRHKRERYQMAAMQITQIKRSNITS